MASNYLLPNNTQPASTTKTGIVKIGTGINVDAAGTISTDLTTLGAAPLNSPDLTGTPTAPTAAAATNNTQIATTAYVKSQSYAALASPTFTGTPKAPTATVGTNDTQIATTAFVKLQGYATLASPAFTGLPKITTGVTKAAGDGLTEAFRIESSDTQALFQVMTNGDTKIAGVITVSGTGTSTFAGDVDIAGKLTVAEDSTAVADLSGQDLTLTGNLIVEGNTTLGNDATLDTTTVKGYTKIVTKTDKTVGADATVEVFRIEDKNAAPLFQVKGNGDTVIGGVLTVQGTGESTFAGSLDITGDVDIGGSLTVSGTATATADLSGTNLTLTGNLIVNGNTTLGNNASEDSTLIKGTTTIISKTTKALGSDTVAAFKIVDSSESTSLFEVKENGDTVVGGILTVSGTGTSTFAGDITIGGALTVNNGATIDATLSGDTMTLTGNLTVNGNTTLGDAGTDTITVKGATTFQSTVTLNADPTQAMHAATKQYVDNIVAGLDPKPSVRAATVANITLSGTQTIDGVTLVVGNRVLVKNQTDKKQNGIYVVASGAWTRSTDADNSPSGEVTSGMYVFVEEGTTNADSGWVLTTDGTITLGTTLLDFVQFSGAGQITAGTGIVKTGNTLSLAKASAGTLGGVRIGNGIDIDTDGIISVSATGTGGIATSEVTVVATADKIVRRTNDGSAQVKDIIMSGKVAQVNGISTTGNYGVMTLTANANDVQLVNTTANNIASFTPATKGNFIIYIYFRVLNASTNLTIETLYTDGTGAQTQTIVSGSQTVGSYSVSPLFINAVNGDPITVRATAGTANNVYVSANIAGL